MYNKHRKMCLGAEAIMCGERKEAYMFMCNFIFKNTPMRPVSSVNNVTGDVFFNQNMIEEFGFINAKYLKDWFHLFDTGLKELFGEDTSKLLKGELIQMAKAPSRDYFDKVLENAIIKLRNMLQPDAALKETLELFYIRV